MNHPRPPAHVLVVDDEPLVLNLAAIVLTTAGFRVTKASDGTTAAAQLTDPSLKFHAAVIDCGLPDVSGPDVVATIRQQQILTPVLLLSGDPRHEYTLPADPATRFLAKPFRGDELVRQVSGLVSPARCL